MLQVAQVAVCSQINTKHKNTMWAERTVVAILNFKFHYFQISLFSTVQSLFIIHLYTNKIALKFTLLKTTH